MQVINVVSSIISDPCVKNENRVFVGETQFSVNNLINV